MACRVKEPFNGFSHLLGAVLSVAGLAVLVSLAAIHATAWHVVSFSLFGATMILLYGASALYHLAPVSGRCERRLQTADHIMIFMLIAGTYSPICLVVLQGGWGWALFGTVWGLALAGVAFKIFWMDAPRWLSTGIYLAMGWICVIAVYPLVLNMPAGGLAWLAGGGLCYSIGAVIYALKKPNPWPARFGSHGLFHLFVMAGTFCHWWAMLAYVMDLPA